MILLQYRPPIEAFCVEFPAGLIDEGETPEQAAVRELKEETGYEGKVCTVLELSPVLSCQPGMTNASMMVRDADVLLSHRLSMSVLRSLQILVSRTQICRYDLWAALPEFG